MTARERMQARAKRAAYKLRMYHPWYIYERAYARGFLAGKRAARRTARERSPC